MYSIACINLRKCYSSDPSLRYGLEEKNYKKLLTQIFG